MAEKKILVVDDSEVVRKVVGRRLEKAGYAVETLESAFQLNRAIRLHEPDLILLDVHMPALSGDKAASILRQYGFSRGIPVILHSDLDAASLASLVEQTGAAGFIRKSSDTDDLADRLRPWLDATTVSTPPRRRRAPRAGGRSRVSRSGGGP